VQVERFAGARHFDGVEIVRQHGAGVAAPDRQFVGAAQFAFARCLTPVGALVENVVLVAVDPRNRGPGRVVVRRLRLAGHARRAVEREASVGVLGKVVDGAGAAREVGEVLGRKQFAAAGKRDQLGLDLLQRRPGGALARLDRAYLLDQLVHRTGA
jgi:hypothetical protein